ncbi:hypothetical protein V495_01083 [Pseudogymnoascus sp. VKM F-4514 (FW-929)]|nr:hypothetical protein V495_01083 [Pseudogymnoascus sp. VKM F-4514 (FW-929)]KFY56228.1 hypothetical protein V497_06443 [Pseudogymnoascus sp. VKM F-4516 (FW-969)]
MKALIAFLAVLAQLGIASRSPDEMLEARACLRQGVRCGNFFGPIGLCCPGTHCIYVEPDVGYCLPE